MDFPNEISSETKYMNVCRCCFKEDGFMDIFTSFPQPDVKETCEGMLKYTFDIQISHDTKISKSLICATCIKSLQEATIFKQTVEKSEKMFQEYLMNLQTEFLATNVYNPEVKEIKQEVEDAFQDYNEESPDDNETLSNFKLPERNLEEKVSLKHRKCKLERKSKLKKCKIKENHEIEMNITQEKVKDWSKIAERRGTGPLLRDNSLKLIQNSNLCVFQWNKSQYRCFCCNAPFSDINLLKTHTSEHSLENIEKKIIQQQNRLVKVEITNLECKLCREKLETIEIFTQHLSRNHSIEIKEHLLVPFRIEDELKCQICLEKFTVFRLLNIHINKHFQKQVCHICGAGFSNLVFLNLHKTRSHRPFHCKPCDLTFESKPDKRKHDKTTHGLKFERKLRFPCPYCPERFCQENFKVKHLVESHGLTKPDHKCNFCPKSFLTRSLCNNHVKNVHNKEKNKECDVCHTFFYTKSDVVRHKVTHTGEKKYSCLVCNNLFASRDSLRRHMKRIHIGVQ